MSFNPKIRPSSKAKRKKPHDKHGQHHPPSAFASSSSAPDPAQFFSIQGYEATLTRVRSSQGVTGKEGLIDWEGELPLGMETIKVDRHDILHLLKSLPSTFKAAPPSPASSTGWTDLPSDAEDTFFFSEDEAQEFERGKKRRKIDEGREERLRKLKEAEPVEETVVEEEPEDDGVPPSPIMHTMRHTLSALLSSPNPQVLELRILTHHASDARFSFLKSGGKYSEAWNQLKEEEKEKAKVAKEQEEEAKTKAKKAPKKGLGGLMGAYDSDSDEEDADEDAGQGEGTAADEGKDKVEQPPLPPTAELPPPPEDVPPPPDEEPAPPPLPDEQSPSEMDAQAARRAKAKEWARLRKAEGGGVV